jgi:regulator of protease activity HflC (stomatin/prohibitin superfamily)
MGGFFGILLAFVVVSFIGSRLMARRRPRPEVFDTDGRRVSKPPYAALVGNLAYLIPAAILVVAFLTSVRNIPVGHALVAFNTVTKNFQLERQGIALVAPFVTVTQLYDLRRLEYTMSGTQGEGRKSEADDSLWSPTQEGLLVGIDITVWHHLDPSRVVEIHQKIGPDYEEKIIRPAIRSVIRLVISEYPVMDVYSSKRAHIQDEINEKIRKLVEKDGFLIDEIVLRDVRFTDQFAKSIEAKQIAQQSAEQMKYVLEKEQKEAERKVIEATGRAKSIETINEALRQNPNYIRYLYVDKLSDKISVIVSDQSTIMDLKGILDSKGK